MSGICFAQSVPDTTTFSLQDVINVVKVSYPTVTNDLQSCFDNSVSGYFDVTYGSKTMSPKTLLGFRNYQVIRGNVIVFEICNSNAQVDDNFEIYLNGVSLGTAILGSNAQIGSYFIGSPNTYTITPDFTCPLTSMVGYSFDATILRPTNTIIMSNIQNNHNGNYGSIGVRYYTVSGTTLISPVNKGDFVYSGASGSSYDFTFSFP